MGEEVNKSHFDHSDFKEFKRRLHHETRLLKKWFKTGNFAFPGRSLGLELETCLVDQSFRPSPRNDEFLSVLKNPLVVPELSAFNAEVNTIPQRLKGPCLRLIHEELRSTWRAIKRCTEKLHLHMLMIGTLPTLTPKMLGLTNMSNKDRYKALNEQIMKLRQGRELTIHINGRETLTVGHRNVMLEASCTALQIHLQVEPGRLADVYNAALIASAPMVALSANSPYLFGRDLWDETRIPVFEQAVELPGFYDPTGRIVRRVGLGSGYIKRTLFECFHENLDDYPILLPLLSDAHPNQLHHLRLHNGTIWRWNRPIIGMTAEGRPYLRVEHRVPAAGPTLTDMVANIAFFTGLVHFLTHGRTPPWRLLSFDRARSNFYQAARYGLGGFVTWFNNQRTDLRNLLLSQLIDEARRGLTDLKIDRRDIRFYLDDVLRYRVESGQNGAAWQRSYVAHQGANFEKLALEYYRHQESDRPVHSWKCPGRLYREIHGFPKELLRAQVEDLQGILGGPTLISLNGERSPPLFVSVLLHGNEHTGLYAVQRLLKEYWGRGRPLPRRLYLLIGNVRAAARNQRRLKGQPDFNRIWKDSRVKEGRIMQSLAQRMQGEGLFASVDIHNNSGRNPHYVSLSKLKPDHVNLAALFRPTIVFSTKPQGTQSVVFSEFTPSVIIECGLSGDPSGINRAAHFLSTLINLKEINPSPPHPSRINLFETFACLRIPPGTAFALEKERSAYAQIILRDDIDTLNFRDVRPGTILGRIRRGSSATLHLQDPDGRSYSTSYLDTIEGKIVTTRPFVASMFTPNKKIIRDDCLGYLMHHKNLAQ